MIRPGNAIAIGILAVASGGLIARAAVALSEDRPSIPAPCTTSYTCDVDPSTTDQDGYR
jgi:hypothetical protein